MRRKCIKCFSIYDDLYSKSECSYCMCNIKSIIYKELELELKISLSILEIDLIYIKNKIKSIKSNNFIKKVNSNNIIKINNRIRYNSDSMYKLKVDMRNLIKQSFNSKSYNKSSKTEDILGCSYYEFKKYIEDQFEPWMTWENKGLYNGEFNYGWDIDHIIPVSSAKNMDEMIILNHYKNLRPLCSKINRYIKRDKIENPPR